VKLRRRHALGALGAAAAVLAALAGCRQNMHDQPKYEPYEATRLFADGASARPLPAGTVPRGFLRADAGYHTGLARDGRLVASFPVPVTRRLLARGRERYDIFCSPCHDRVGSGRGMIVRRGFTQPPSFHDPRLRASPPGYFVNVMTEGFGVMPSYAAQVAPADRWAIAAYLQVLQLAQEARLADLPPAARAAVEEELAQARGGGGASTTPLGGRP
jgi:mono/diheme cytochrome c family protein